MAGETAQGRDADADAVAVWCRAVVDAETGGVAEISAGNEGRDRAGLHEASLDPMQKSLQISHEKILVDKQRIFATEQFRLLYGKTLRNIGFATPAKSALSEPWISVTPRQSMR